MKKIVQYIIIFLLLTIGNSCNEEEFLNITPQAADNEAAFYKNMLHADQAITACYSQFNSLAAWDRGIIMCFGEIASDDAEAGGNMSMKLKRLNLSTAYSPDQPMGTTTRFGVLITVQSTLLIRRLLNYQVLLIQTRMLI